MAKYRRLRHEDRCQIYALLQQGISQQRIAAQLDVSQGAISRKVSRNAGRRAYSSEDAHAKALSRQRVRATPRKLTSQIRRKIPHLLAYRAGNATGYPAAAASDPPACAHDHLRQRQGIRTA